MDAQRGSATVPVVKEVTLRLARPDERRRWDALMDRHHPLGFKQFAGRGLRYVAVWQGEWLALLGWQTGVFQCRPREQWLGWHKAVQFQRLHLIANNTRFVMLPEGTGVKPRFAEAILSFKAGNIALILSFTEWVLRKGSR